jgi:DNA-binding transcriptional regulator YiaG
MTNIATVLKHEISRLARKEVRAGTESTRKASSQYRRDIAELKRQVAALSRQLATLAKQQRTATPVPLNDDNGTAGRRFSARGLRTHREKLGLSAADYGALVGVTGQTIYNWEQGRSRPRPAQLASLMHVRGLGKREAWRRLEQAEG